MRSRPIIEVVAVLGAFSRLPGFFVQITDDVRPYISIKIATLNPNRVSILKLKATSNY